jgi:hypothetical protein
MAWAVIQETVILQSADVVNLIESFLLGALGGGGVGKQVRLSLCVSLNEICLSGKCFSVSELVWVADGPPGVKLGGKQGWNCNARQMRTARVKPLSTFSTAYAATFPC